MNINFNRGFLLLTGKLLVILLTVYLLYQAIFEAPDAFLTWGSIVNNAFSSNLLVLLFYAGILIPVNWGFEAFKWQLLGQKLEPLSFARAYRAVMVGLTLGFITPNRLGDYAGRVLELKTSQRLDAIGAIFIGRYCQLVATVLVGTLGLSYFVLRFYLVPHPLIAISLILSLVSLSSATLLILYHANVMVKLINAIKPLRPLVRYVAVMGTYSGKEISKLLWLSLGRYFVFLLQFILLLVMFGVKLSLVEYLSGVSGTFFLKSVVPSVSLISDLGIRELSAMYLFGLLGQVRLQVLSASLSLWLLNIAIPSAIGLIFVLRLRMARKKVTA